MTLFMAAAVIPAGESLSNSIDTLQGATNSSIVAVVLPSTWNVAGGITFQISYDDVEFHDLFERDGKEIIWAVTPGGAILIGPEFAKATHFLRVRSGTREVPVAQSAARTFGFVLWN